MQHARTMNPPSEGEGQFGAAAGGGMHWPPLIEPHVLVAGFAQHAAAGMIGMLAGSMGEVHIVVPQGTGAAAPVPAVVPTPPTPPVTKPVPPVTCAGVPVPSSPPHPNTLTKQASATAVHHALFICWNHSVYTDAHCARRPPAYHRV
jgi:hypothetical protein